MRRGSRGNHFQAPWRWRDVPIQSSMPLKHSEANIFKLLITLAAFSTIISIIVWNSRRHGPSEDLHLTKPGFVFPLYHYHRQLPNASNDLEGEMLQGSSATSGRALRQASHPFFELSDGYYIKMKLGDPPQKFHFTIDTGSKHTWVYCKVSGHESKLGSLGPNGMFEPADNTCLKCIGEAHTLCEELQDYERRPCNSENNYECLVRLRYVDKTTYTGVFVTESLTVPLQDGSEVNIHGVFSCITQMGSNSDSIDSSHVDGIIGLGPCKHTLVNQWFTKKIISQNVVGLCIAKVLQNPLIHKEECIGYMSVGIDYKEKFIHKNHRIWAKLHTDTSDSCHCIATLLFISFEYQLFKPPSNYKSKAKFKDSNFHQKIGVPILIDTGTHRTYLDSVLYVPLLKMAKMPISISPSRDFSVLIFAFDGVPSASVLDPIHYLNVQPQNYLEWHPDEEKLCVNIIEDDKFPTLGVELMREHLFVFDYDNQRGQWKPDKCTL